MNLVIGLTGLKAGGKDTLARLLSKRGFNVRGVSDALRVEWAKRGVDDPTVAQLVELGNWGREHSGDSGYWAGRLLEIMSAENNPRMAINGIRNPGEIETMRRVAGSSFVLVGVVAPTWLRYQRAMKRKQGGDPSELEGFLAMDDRDRGLGQPEAGQQVDRCLAMCEPQNIYNNDGTMEEFEQWMLGLLERHSQLVG